MYPKIELTRREIVINKMTEDSSKKYGENATLNRSMATFAYIQELTGEYFWQFMAVVISCSMLITLMVLAIVTVACCGCGCCCFRSEEDLFGDKLKDFE